VTKGQLALLWGLAVGIVMVFAALTYVLSRPAASVQPLVERRPVATPVGSAQQSELYLLPQTPNSARALYDRAEQAAHEWQPDAGLASAVASWPFATLDGLSRPVDWTFSFFSPSTQRLYVLNVHPERITPIRETLSPYPLPILSPEQWRVDSYQALNAWLNGGGGDLMRSHPVVDVSARLRLDDERLVWSVIGLGPEGQPVWGVLLDAVDGDPVR
jgi:hypothetical protein